MKYLFVFAHPDDESVACAGTIKNLIDQGNEVNLVVATYGDGGEVSKEAQAKLKQAGSVGKLRQQELEGAVQHLGVTQLIVLNYQDGEINNKTVWGQLTLDIVDQIDKLKPDAVITFDHTGWYFHLDHVGVSIATTIAYNQAEHQPLALLHSHFQPSTKGEQKWKYVFHPSPATHQVKVDDKQHKQTALKFHQSQDLSRVKEFVDESQPHLELYELAFATKEGEKLFKSHSVFKKIDK